MTAADESADPGEWLQAPFEEVDPERVVCRFDVSTVFDEEFDDDIEDDEDEEDIEDDEDRDDEDGDADLTELDGDLDTDLDTDLDEDEDDEPARLEADR